MSLWPVKTMLGMLDASGLLRKATTAAERAIERDASKLT